MVDSNRRLWEALMGAIDSERSTQLLLSVMRGRNKQDVIKNEEEGKLWDELVVQAREIKEEGYAIHIPSD
jgi:hypothetical protein